MPNETHFRKLERMYAAAPTNVYYQPSIQIENGRAEVRIAIRPDFFHSAGAIHGTVYFKVLDDATFFAANSLVDDVFILTTSFNLHMLRPVSKGEIRGVGRVVSQSKRLIIAEAEAFDLQDRLVARGVGTFMRSNIPLGPEVHYT